MSSAMQRGRKTRDYTVVQNELLRDKDLTDGLGLLMFILHLPPDFEFNSQFLQDRFGCGPTRIRSWMKQLAAAGYARLEQRRHDSGQLKGRGWIIDENKTVPDADSMAAELESDDDGYVEYPVGEPSEDDARSAENLHIGRSAGLPNVEKPALPIINTNSNKILPPISPQGGAAPPAGDVRNGKDQDDHLPPDIRALFEQFRPRWRWGDDDSVRRAEIAFGKLTDAQRTDALASLERWLSSRDVRNGKRQSGTAQAYFREHRWEQLPKQGQQPRRFFVQAETPAWEAWSKIHWAAKGKSLPRCHHLVNNRRVEGWFFPRFFPDDTDWRNAGLEPPPPKPKAQAEPPADDLRDVSL